MHYKVNIEHEALCNFLGINKEVRKEVLGTYILES
jgi:hypothetical protein